jgi:hypothetical protein
MSKEFEPTQGRYGPIISSRHKASRALPQNRQWADFLRSLATPSSEPDPLLPKAMKFHPRLHMDIGREDDRLALLHAQCLRLCSGDETRSKRLAADVIWSALQD